MGGLLALLCLLFNIGGGMGGFIAAIMCPFLTPAPHPDLCTVR